MTSSWRDIWRLRADLYRLFGACLLEPIEGEARVALSRAFWEGFPVGPANAEMKKGLDSLLACGTQLLTLPEEAVQKVMIEYTALFLGPGQPQAPPWESLYRTSERVLFGPPTFKVREIFHRYGLEIRRKNKQPEDHIGLELMLLSVVSEKLLEAGELPPEAVIQDQIAFIDEHLLSWIPELCRDAKKHSQTGFYGGLLELIWGTLLWDKELLAEFLESDDKN